MAWTLAGALLRPHLSACPWAPGAPSHHPHLHRRVARVSLARLSGARSTMSQSSVHLRAPPPPRPPAADLHLGLTPHRALASWAFQVRVFLRLWHERTTNPTSWARNQLRNSETSFLLTAEGSVQGPAPEPLPICLFLLIGPLGSVFLAPTRGPARGSRPACAVVAHQDA